MIDHHSSARAEADRLMVICNACRYCEGLCAVFPAMERRRLFLDADVDYLANLCHNCGACFHDCQYAPPHPFDVGVPSTLATVRAETWSDHAWPRLLRHLFDNNPLAVAVATMVAVAGFVLAVVAADGWGGLWQRHEGPGAFYEVVSHRVMVVVFVAGLGFAVGAMGVAVARFWRSIDGGPARSIRLGDLAAAAGAANRLDHLDGGGVGCMNEDDAPTDNRRFYHHLTYYGFAACLASTTLAAVLDSGFGSHAPYAWYHPVVVLGTVGGVGLVVGPVGLWRAKSRRAPELGDPSLGSMERTFLVILVVVAATGLATLGLRSTAAMPLILVVHLGVVLAFFVTMPYTKFVHGAFRFAALVKDQTERDR